ncbi:MAG: flagellar motor protein MotB [Burkholderiales bacterium]
MPVLGAESQDRNTAAPFTEIPAEDDASLKIFFGQPQTGQRALRRLKRRVRRQRNLGETDNQDRWLISYSDFITLLFAFFVVMYAISQVNESKYRVLSESIIQAFRPQGNLEAKSILENKIGQPSTTPVPAGVIPHAVPNPEVPKIPHLPKLRDVELEIRKELDPLIQTGDIRIASGTQGLSIELNAKVSFKTGEAAMTFDSFLPLKQVARILARNAHSIRVEGHTGGETIGDQQVYPTQWELSTARASRVVRYFIDNGVDPQRLAAAGYSDTRMSDLANNRRVSIVVLPQGGETAPVTTSVLPDGSVSPNVKELH